MGRHGIFRIPVGIGWHHFKQLKADDGKSPLLACEMHWSPECKEHPGGKK